MFLQKLDEAEFDDPKFDYVVEIKCGEKISFGSTMKRNTDPIGKGLSPVQKKTAPELFPRTGPGCYHTEEIRSAMRDQLHKIRSIAGMPPLASKTPRFATKGKQIRIPSPGRYEMINYWADTKQSAAPFGVGGKVRWLRESDVPGPMTYDIRKIRKCRRSKKMNNFGYPVMIPCVEVICVSKPTDTCKQCLNLCVGDYWHRNYDTFLCQLCWQEAKQRRAVSPAVLKGFRKIRNCSFMHNHEGTKAAERILSLSKVNKKIRLENYLEEYMRGTC